MGFQGSPIPLTRSAGFWKSILIAHASAFVYYPVFGEGWMLAK
jgi:hypothetical protein